MASGTVAATVASVVLCVCVVAFGSATLADAQARCGTSENPGLSCSDIYDAGGSIGNGVYRVRAPDGTTHSVYCDMEGGGLQLVAKMRYGDDNIYGNRPDSMDEAWRDGECCRCAGLGLASVSSSHACGTRPSRPPRLTRSCLRVTHTLPCGVWCRARPLVCARCAGSLNHGEDDTARMNPADGATGHVRVAYAPRARFLRASPVCMARYPLRP